MTAGGRRSRTGRALLVVGVLAVAAAALAIQGWSVTLRFVGPEASRPESSPPAASAIRRDRGLVYLRLRPIGRYGLFDIAGGSAGVAPASLAPRAFPGLHLTFSREWPQGSYQIGAHPIEPSPATKGQGPVRLICDACSAVNSVFHRSPDSSAGEKLLIDAASFSMIWMIGNGRMTIVQWDP
ncbi:MAG TPA: hypothetical protein VK881_06400 [bacterium]|nr:hypothetical protein [bacterium]